MKMPKETSKFMGIAGNVLNAADIGKTTYDVYKGKKPVSEIVKKASKPAVGFIVKRGLMAAGVGTGGVGIVATLVLGAAVDMAIDYACNR